MQLPSINHITEKTTSTLKRFPFAILSASIGVVISIYLVENSGTEITQLYNILLVSSLGIPLFTITKLVSENRNLTRWLTAGLHFSGILLLLAYFFSLPADLDGAPLLYFYRHALYVISVHLLVAIGPYWNRGKMGAFWQYNKTMFLRFLTAVLFSGVLFAGLSIALLSIDVLLEISINDNRYVELFILIGGIFNTWFFLAGIPSMQAFDERSDYPKGLKIFTQNILIPLVIIYLVILYLYAGKIILQWSWPEGWVANLILFFSIAGILALLLLHPIQERVENRWIKRFSTGYFRALVPLVVLLMMAIYRRVWEYGITIERYFVIILALWLAGIVIYYLISKTGNIKAIPGSLCLLVFFISFGPWGAFSVSERSQVNRLQGYLQKNKILLGGDTIRKAAGPVPFEERREISSIVRYLNTNHGLSGIQPWFDQDLSNLVEAAPNADTTRSVSHFQRPEYTIGLMGIEYVHPGASVPPNTIQNEFYTERNNIIHVATANYLIENINWSDYQDTEEYTLPDSRTVIIESKLKNPHIRIYLTGREKNAIEINVNDIIDELAASHPAQQSELSPDDMTFTFTSEQFAVSVYFERIVWDDKESTESRKLINVNYMMGIR